MKQLLAILLLLSSLSAYTQTELKLRGRITDVETGNPITGAFINISGTPYGANSGMDGWYEITCKQALDSFSVSARSLNYVTQTVHKTSGIKKDEKREMIIHFKLQFEAFMLPPVSISDAPDTVWGSKELNVADFAFVPQGMLLLAYEKEDRWKRQEDAKVTLYSGCRLILLDANGKEITRRLIGETCINLYTGYFDDVFLRCHKQTYHVFIEDGLIVLFPINEKDFENGIKPVVDTIGSLTYFSNYDENFPAFQYMIFNRADSSYSTFRHIIDEEMMRMLRSEYKYLDPRGKLDALKLELKTGIDKEVIAAYMRGFQNTYYYEKLNAPLIVSNDTLLLFDHNHSKMVRFDWQGQALDSILISYHKLSKPERWSEQLLKDNISELIYTYSQKNGYTYAKQIDTKTGNSLPDYKLTHRYVSNIRIKDHWVYYIYRPFENSQNRFLYKERLP